MSTDTPERLWRRSEVAEYLRESQRTVDRRVKRGELTPIRLSGGRKVLFRDAEVRQLVAEAVQ